MELQQEISAIKVSVARIEVRLNNFDSFTKLYTSMEARIRELENARYKLIGYCAGISAVFGLIGITIGKFL